MRYMKSNLAVEVKLRFDSMMHEKLKELARVKDLSLSKLVNDLLKITLQGETSGTLNEVMFSEKPAIIFETNGSRLYNNDFLRVDLSEYIGKVNLIVTSPPYNVAVEYDLHNDETSYEEYLKFTEAWLKKVYVLLADDGRLCLNIPLDKNKQGIKPVYADIVAIAKRVGLQYQSTIIWNEQNISRRTAWGSWMSASAPYVIAPVEMIAVFYKKSWKKLKDGKSTITKDEFIEWTNGVWSFSGESKKRVNHPAPFPVELPRRCIRLFSYEDDIVMDPFIGSGTTMIAALNENRRCIGVEISKAYIEIAIQRIKKECRPYLINPNTI